MIGEINYGGRVSDIHDRSLMMVILKKFMTSNVIREDFSMKDLYGISE